MATDPQPALSERRYTVELTASELSATIEAFNVADWSPQGRPPLKTGTLIRGEGPHGSRTLMAPAGVSAWRKFVATEGGR